MAARTAARNHALFGRPDGRIRVHPFPGKSGAWPVLAMTKPRIRGQRFFGGSNPEDGSCARGCPEPRFGGACWTACCRIFARVHPTATTRTSSIGSVVNRLFPGPRRPARRDRTLSSQCNALCHSVVYHSAVYTVLGVMLSRRFKKEFSRSCCPAQSPRAPEPPWKCDRVGQPQEGPARRSSSPRFVSRPIPHVGGTLHCTSWWHGASTIGRRAPLVPPAGSARAESFVGDALSRVRHSACSSGTPIAVPLNKVSAAQSARIGSQTPGCLNKLWRKDLRVAPPHCISQGIVAAYNKECTFLRQIAIHLR